MAGLLDLRVSELLMARLCHELAGPIAAVGNGVELLAEEDPGFAGEALELLAESARRAGNRLQFYRFAYGIIGDGTPFGSAVPAQLVAALFEKTAIACECASSVGALPLPWQKLACNLVIVGAELLPRGGTVAVSAAARGLVLEAAGETVARTKEFDAALALTFPAAALTTRSVQPYFTALLARELGCRIACRAAARSLRIVAVVADQAAAEP